MKMHCSAYRATSKWINAPRRRRTLKLAGPTCPSKKSPATKYSESSLTIECVSNSTSPRLLSAPKQEWGNWRACKWGLETGVLRMTANSLVTSLLRYGLASVGSGAYEQPLSRIDAAAINITARRVLWVTCSARLPTLHASAGVKSIHNQYLQRCGELLDSALRAEASSIQDRMQDWVQKAKKSAELGNRADQLCCLPSATPATATVRKPKSRDPGGMGSQRATDRAGVPSAAGNPIHFSVDVVQLF